MFFFCNHATAAHQHSSPLSLKAHTFIGNTSHLQLGDRSEIIDEKYNLVRPIALEGDERTVFIGRIGDLGQHVVDQVCGGFQG